MKKTLRNLALGVMALVGLSAQAVTFNGTTYDEWYIVGSGIGWNDNDTYKLTKVDDNNYKIHLDQLSGTMKIKPKGTWDPSVGNNNNQKLAAGDVSVYFGNGSGDITIDGTLMDVTLVLDFSKNVVNPTIHVTVGSSKENDYDTVYIVGDINNGGWNEGITTYPMTSTDNQVWTGDITITSNSYFKIKCGTYIYGVNGEDDQLVASGIEYDAFPATPKSFSITPGDYTVKFDVVKNADSGKLTVTAKGEVKMPEQIYVIGEVSESNGSWSCDAGAVLSQTEKGVYEGDVTLSGGNQFSFAVTLASTPGDWDSMGQRYAPYDDIAINDDIVTELSFSNGGKCWNAANGSGTYKFVVNLNDYKFTIKKTTAAPDPVYPTSLYVIGNVEAATSSNWDPTVGIELTSNDQGKTWEGEGTLQDFGDTAAYFAFAENLGTSSSDWNLGIRFSAGSDTPVTAGVQAELKRGNDGAWNIAAGTYKFNVDIDAMTFTLTEVAEAVPVISATVEGDQNDGKYSGTVKVTLEADQPDAKIYYTTDDTEPDETKTLYTAPIEFTTDTTLKAVAVMPKGTKSEVHQSTYQFSTTGIGSIEADNANAPVEIYNLQGVRIANPSAGQVVIVRQGNDVKKVLVK